MSQQRRSHPLAEDAHVRVGPSEPESHTEHRAALEATIFRAEQTSWELVLELECGELRVRPHRRP